MKTISRCTMAACFFLLFATPSISQDLPEPLPELDWKSSPAPWEPLDHSRNDYLQILADLVESIRQFQNSEGAIIDPFLEREHQYATPYYLFGAATLIDEGHGEELLPSALSAMEHASKQFAAGHDSIPDGHGEFFIAPLTGSLQLLKPHVNPNQWKQWQKRLKTPLDQVIESRDKKTNNWRTYAMKGEWARVEAGLSDEAATKAFIADAWTRRTQRERMANDKWNLYQDWNGDPQSHAVEAVGRGNLIGLVLGGYDGDFAGEILEYIGKATRTSLLLQDPTGQCPPNGRTDNHVFNDLLYQLIYQNASEVHWPDEPHLAGQYRRAALLAFDSQQRWRRIDDNWAGSFYVTKNHFDPADRVGYQKASQYTNYNGAMIYHLAEAIHALKSDIPQVPTYSEIGGYAISMDSAFSTVVANAGGMQVVVNLRGDTIKKYGDYWTPLGGVRFSRANWDSRLGPSDGARNGENGDGVTFGPTWKQFPGWVRLTEKAEHYRGSFHAHEAHPTQVRFTILYSPVSGVGGPFFYVHYVVTPDGVLVTLDAPGLKEFGLTLPLLINDGRDLEYQIGDRIVSTNYKNGTDRQNFLILNENAQVTKSGEPIQSTYGWLQPVRVSTQSGEPIEVFVYPRSADDPPASEVRKSFFRTSDGFESILGSVAPQSYRGRFALGGTGKSIDFDDDGTPEIGLSESCEYLIRHETGRPILIETNTDVRMTYKQSTHDLKSHVPLNF